MICLRPKGGSNPVYVPPKVNMGVIPEQCNRRQHECMTVIRAQTIDVKA